MRKFCIARQIVLLPCILVACISPVFPADNPAPLLRALVLSGDNNHKWKETTPVIVGALKASGRFSVDVEENVPGMKPGAFAPYDVIVSNYNTFGSKRPGEIWDAATKTAFLDHIRQGRGLVIIHAGSSVFYDWPEFQALACGTWQDGTNHGKIHDNRVTFTSEKSPITGGLEPFWTRDEFWQKIKVAPGAKALAEVTPLPEFKGSGKPEPILFSTEVGGGRGVALFLGHDVAAMSNPAWQTLLQRGAEWAATGKVTVPPAKNWPAKEPVTAGKPGVGTPPSATVPVSGQVTLDSLVSALKSYRYADKRDALVGGDKLVGQAAGTSEATKIAAALSSLLSDPSVSSDAKRYVCFELRLIGGKADVPFLSTLLKDTGLAVDAVEALAAIPDPEATIALRKAEGTSAPEIKAQIAQALKRRDRNPGPPKPGFVLVFGEKPDSDALIAALRGSDPARQKTALTAFAARYSPASAVKFASALRSFPPGVKLAVLRILADHRDQKAVSAILEAAAAETDPAVGVGFIGALGAIGDSSAIPFFLSRISSPEQTVRSASLMGLEQVRGTDATRKIADALATLPDESRAAVLAVLALRRDPASFPCVLEATKSGDVKARQAAVRAVGKIADASQVAAILAAIESAVPADLALWETALASAARTGNRDAGVEAIAAALKNAGDDKIPMLLTAAGAAGTDAALVLLRVKIQSPDEQVRRVVLTAMGRALNPVLLPDLQKAAANDPSPALRKLALRKLADTILSGNAIPPESALDLIVLTVPAASDSDDRRALLAALGGVKSERAPGVVAQIEASDPGVSSEASVATAQIYKLLKKTPPPVTAKPNPSN